MSEPSPDPTDPPIDPPEKKTTGRRKWRRLWRVLKWGSVFGVLLLLLLVLGGWLAYAKRTVILNALLEDAAAPYRIVAGRLDLDASGNLDVYDVRLEEEQTDGSVGVVITIPHARGVLDFRDALEGKFVSIEIERPVIHVPLSTIMQSEAPAGLEAIEEEVSNIAPAFASPRFALERLVIDDAELTISDNGLDVPDGDVASAPISARFDYDADALALYSDGSIETRRHKLSLREIGLGEWVTIPTAEAEYSIHREGGLVQLHSLEIPAAKVASDDALVRWLVDAGFGPFYLPPEDSAGPAGGDDAEPGVAGNAPTNAPFSFLEVEKLAIGEVDIAVEDFPGAPDFEGKLTVEVENLTVPFASESIADGLRLGALQLKLLDVQVRLPEQSEPEAFAILPATTVSMRRGDDGIYEVTEWIANDLGFSITPGVVDFFSAAAEATTEKEAVATDPVTLPDSFEVRLVSGEVNRCSVAVSGFEQLGDGRKFFVPDISTTMDATLRDVSLSNQGVRSGEVQEFSVSDVSATLEDAQDLVQICGIQVAVVPDDFLESGHLLECLIESPDVRLTEPFWERVAEMNGVDPVDGSITESTAPPEDRSLAAWQRVTADVMEVHNGFFEFVQTDTKIPNFSGRLEVHTRQLDGNDAADRDGQEYLVDASGMEFYAPADPSAPVARAQSLEIVVDSATLWSEKRVTSATLKGAELLAGKRFDTLLDDAVSSVASEDSAGIAPPPSETPPPALAPRSSWHVGEVQVEDSVVVVEDLATLIPDISLPVKAKLSDFPLTKAGFYSHDEPLKVEVAQLRIPSPYGQARTPVAEFDSVFIHFSLAGLMRNELAKVELLHPTIYIGENLFWYVEFFRKAEVAKAAEVEAANAGDTEVSAAALAVAADDEGWSVEQIDAFYGQLIIALNGSINPDLPAFPFSCSTALKDGTLSASLDIPGGDYRPLEGVDLTVKVTDGHADFNLPLGQDSNNLVEVFQAEELRYKQFVTTEVHLSVTYDQYGIYAQFGGETYEGYTNGAVNLYINDDFTWDAWVTGSKVSATEMTRVLTPEYYLMSGAADFKVIAQGDLSALYQAYGDFSMDEPGIISIPALDELKGKFPDDWTTLKTSLADVGVGALRDLPFETCTAEFKIFEREGTLHLRAAGPSGSREFNLAIHDYRLPPPVKILELAYTNDDVDSVPSPQ